MFARALNTLDILRTIMADWVLAWTSGMDEAGMDEATRRASFFASFVSTITGVVGSIEGVKLEEGLAASQRAFADALMALDGLRSELDKHIRLWTVGMDADGLDLAGKQASFVGSLIGVITGIVGSIEGTTYKNALAISQRAFADALKNLDGLRAEIQKHIALWTAGMDEAGLKDATDRAKFFGTAVKAIADVVSSVADLSQARVSGITGLDQIKENIRVLVQDVGSVLDDIDVVSAELQARTSTAIGTVAENLSKLTGGLDEIMDGPFFGIRARSMRGFEAAASRRGDMIKAAIQASITTLVDALTGLDIPADLGEKFKPLADAADAIASAMAKLNEIVAPEGLDEIIRAAGLLASAPALAPAGMGAGGLGGTTPGGTGFTLGSNPGGGLLLKVEVEPVPFELPLKIENINTIRIGNRTIETVTDEVETRLSARMKFITAPKGP